MTPFPLCPFGRRGRALALAAPFFLPACGLGDDPPAPSLPPVAPEIATVEQHLGAPTVPVIIATNSVFVDKTSNVRGDILVTQKSVGPWLSQSAELTLGANTFVTGNVKADTLYLTAGSSVTANGDYNELKSTGAIGGVKTTPLPLPLDITLPTTPTVTPGATAYSVASKADITLAAGPQAGVTLSAGIATDATTLTLSGGVYEFASLTQGNYSRLECASACEIRIAGRLSQGTATYLGPRPGTTLTAADVVVFVAGKNGTTGALGATPKAAVLGTEVIADVFVPNGTLQLKAATTATGRFVARDVHVLTTAKLYAGIGPCTKLTDTTCDGVDDDCDASVDEDFEANATGCGTGACARTGALSCDGTTVRDSCVPGIASPSDATCNAIDDDCDGEVDEDFIARCDGESATLCDFGVERTASCAPWTLWRDAAIIATNSAFIDKTSKVTGDVLVTQATPGPWLSQKSALTLGASTLITGSAQANTMYLTAGSKITGEGAYNQVKSTGVIEGPTRTPLTLPLDVGFPPLPTVTPGTVATTVAAKADQALAPGRHAAIKLTAGIATDSTVLTLTGGLYEFQSLTQGNYSRVECAAPCAIRIEGRLSQGTATYLGPQPGTPFDASDVSVFVAGVNGSSGTLTASPKSAVLGTEVIADVWVPNGTLQLKAATVATGRLAARDVHVLNASTVRTLASLCTKTAASDTTCDGADDDCDGTRDEDYLATTTECGVGACRRTGTTSCSNGTATDSCAPGSPTGNDTTCDATDDDCDGSSDEEYVPLMTMCGVGACARTGATACSAGAVTDGCTPGTPAANDATCDGTDDDCDGSSDEDWVNACDGDALRLCENGAPRNVACSDFDACNGSEICAAAACQAGTPPLVDDQNPCTTDACDPASGVSHAPLATDTPCGPNRICNASAECVIQKFPPVITTQPSAVSASAGAPYTFAVTASGTALQYQWQRDGAPIPGATSATLERAHAEYSETGSRVRVVISNELASVTSDSVLLTVTDDPPPVLTLNASAPQTTFADTVTLAGTASDDASGLAEVYATSDRFGAQRFGATVSQSGAFVLEIPLSAGKNLLRVAARDEANNTREAQAEVTLAIAQAPRVSIQFPEAGSVTSASETEIRGTVRSSLAPEKIRVVLGSQLVFPSGEGGVYAFVLPRVPLNPGTNALTVRAESAAGNAEATVRVTRKDTAPPEAPVPPEIVVTSAPGDRFLTEMTHVVSGTVTSDPCVKSISVNGTAANVVGTGSRVSFDHVLTLSEAGDALDVTVEATGCNAQTATRTYRVRYDGTAPSLTLDALQLAPAVNPVLDTPHRITGRVVESNLAGLSTNTESVGVVPGALAGTWDFSIDVALVRNIERAITFEAWDLAGNRTTREILLKLATGLELTILTPATDATLLMDSSHPDIDVLARADGLAAGDRFVASIGGGTVVSLPRTGVLAQGPVPLPTTPGQYDLTVGVHDGAGASLASRRIRIEVVDAASVPLELVKQAPPNGAQNIESNTPIEFHFNKAIDPALLAVEVRETAHVTTYADGVTGADVTSVGAVGMVEIHHDQTLVPGGVSYFPESALAVFYPSGRYSFTGNLTVTVRYEGAELSRSSYVVRPVPTLLEGFVGDQHMNPLPGIDVYFPELGIATVTDENGFFAFGFGAFAASMPPGDHRVLVNPFRRAASHASSEYLINVAASRTNRAGILRIPLLDTAEPFRSVRSGDPTALLLGGKVNLDLSEAELAYPEQETEGEAHAQGFPTIELGYPVSQDVIPFYAYRITPISIVVSGKVGLDLALPEALGEDGQPAPPPTHVLLMALDPSSLELQPVGIGVVDPATRRARSSAKLDLSRLDFLAMASVPAAFEADVIAVAEGKLSFAEFRARLSGATQGTR